MPLGPEKDLDFGMTATPARPDGAGAEDRVATTGDAFRAYVRQKAQTKCFCLLPHPSVAAEDIIALLDERDRLAAEAAAERGRLLGLLRELEWAATAQHMDDWEGGCPSCKAVECEGHKPDCSLRAALAGEGGA